MRKIKLVAGKREEDTAPRIVNVWIEEESEKLAVWARREGNTAAKVICRIIVNHELGVKDDPNTYLSVEVGDDALTDDIVIEV